jgi:ParE toxin of type II toxin-antitoxin system, parDE
MAAYSVRFTENFAVNLESIREFLTLRDANKAFHTVHDQLFEQIVPNLQRSPRMGRDFLVRAPASVEVKMRLRALKKRAGGGMEIRELIAGDYLILYAIKRTSVFLLAIRHHLQLSFDLQGNWL